MTDARVPSRLGRFEIQAPLGAGAFARVVRAHDPQLSSSVAIKILADQWADDADARERFLAEARHLRRVRNPCVVAVHDIGELDDGRPYFVMELADRGSLEQRLEQQRGPYPDLDGGAGLARLIEGLGEGMGAIHRAGLVHRDLNPRNLLLRSTAGDLGLEAEIPAGEQATTIGGSIVREDERLIIADLGLAKDLIDSHEVSVIGGSSGYQSPEQMIADGELGPWADVYAASALMWRVLTGERPPAVGDFEARRPEVPPQWRPLLRRGLDPDLSRRQQTIEEWADEALEIVGGADRSERLRAAPAPRADECPYRGLASYEPEHAASFFGREDLTADAIARIGAERVLAVLGASGSGKSSVVRAGVIPGIRAGELPGSEAWPVILMTPGSDPIGEMRYQLRRAAEATGVAVDLDAPAEDLGYEWRRMADSITDRTGGLLVVADQFEEVFTHDPDGSTAGRFLDALAAMVDPAASRVHLVMSMRADFYGEAAGHRWLAKRLGDNQLLVGPMDAVQLRRAITGPAERAGLEVEDGLVDVVVAEVGADSGSLPLVGHALVETWRRREGRRFTMAGFRDAGGVAGAIAQTAEAVFTESLDAEQRRAARDLLLRLVTARHGAARTRRRIPLDEVGGVDDPVTDSIVSQLVDARLLTADDSTLQIAHEALIVEWPRLRQWIDESIDDLRLRTHLSRAAVEWREVGDDDAMLFRGTPLAAAQEWAARSPGHLGPLEREFLDASSAAAVAEEERVKATERRQRRARVLSVAGLVGLLVIGVVAWAGIQRTRSIERANAADARVLENLGLVARLSADQDPLVGLALGVEARALTDGPNRDAWLAVIESRLSLAESGLVEVGSVEAGDALSLAMSPDGDRAAIGLRSGMVTLVDVAEQEVVSTISGHAGGIPSLAFGPDGTTLATGGFDGFLQVWEVADGALEPDPIQTIDLGSLVWGLDWSPDGTLLATADEDGIARTWDVATGEPTGAPLVDVLDMLTVAFDPTGTVLLASNGEGIVWGVSLPDGEIRFETNEPHQSDVWELVPSPDGTEFATRSSDGTVAILDIDDGAVLSRPFTDENDLPLASEMRGVRYTPDGRSLVTGTSTGEVLWWDRASETIVSREGPPAGLQVLDADLVGDTLVTLARDQAMRTWRLGSSIDRGVALSVEEGAYAVQLAPDRSFAVTADGTGTVRIHETVTGGVQSEVDVSEMPVWALAVAPDSRTIAVGTDDGDIIFLSSEGEEIDRVSGHDSRVRTMAFHPDGTRLATGGREGVVRVWDVARTTAIAEFGEYAASGGDGVDSLAWSPDGDRLVVVAFDGTAGVWTADGEPVGEPVNVDGDALKSVAYSADGEQVAIGGGSESVTIWSADLTEQLAGPFATLPGGALGVAFLDDDEVLLAVAANGSLRLWDLDSGLPIADPLAGPWGGIQDVSVLPGGPLFATAGVEGHAWVWDILDRPTACAITDGVVDREQPVYLGEGGELTACDGAP